ncbi:MAG TPA: autotransporter-associated beta strand repeat-containing protein [Tepidisphaeraceae bacterium]|jgi:autotransporter-associated beta strand protein
MRRVCPFLALACASVLCLPLTSAYATVQTYDSGLNIVNSSNTSTGFIDGISHNTTVDDNSGTLTLPDSVYIANGTTAGYTSTWIMNNASGFTTFNLILGASGQGGIFSTYDPGDTSAPAWTGTVTISNALSLGSSASNSFAQSAGSISSDTTTINNGTFTVTGGTFSSSGLTLNTGNISVSGGNFGTSALTVNGGNISVTGGMVNAGTLTARGGSVAVTGGTFTGYVNLNTSLYASGGTFETATNYAGGEFINDSLGSGGMVNVGAGGFIVDTHGTNAFIAVPVNHDPGTNGTSGTDGGLTKNGSGTLTLSDAANFHGPITINAGTLEFDAAGSALSNAMTFKGGNLSFYGFTTAVNLSGTYNVQANTTIESLNAGPINFTGGITTTNSPTLEFETSGTSANTFSSAISGTGFSQIIFSGTSPINLSGTSLGTTPVQIIYNTLNISNSATVNGPITMYTQFVATLAYTGGGSNSLTLPGAITLTGTSSSIAHINTALGTTLTLSGGISGNCGLALSTVGNGDIVISNISSYSGPTTISGLVTCTTSTTTTTGGAFPGGQSVTVGSGSILNLNGQYNSLGYNAGLPNLFINNGGILSAGTGTQQNIGNITLTGGTIQNGEFVLDQTLHTAASSTLSDIGAGTTIVLRNDNGVNGVGGTIDVAQGTTSNGVDFDIYGNIAGQTATDALTKTGNGYLCLFGTDTYTGGTTVNAGTLEIDSNTAIPSSGTITLNGGTIRAGGAARTMTNPVAINGSVALGRETYFTGATTLKSDSTVYLDNPDGVANYDSGLTNISGAYNLTVSNGPLHGAGTGYLELNGNNSFTGTLTVNTNVSIGTGATGDGALQGNVIINSGGTLLYKAGNIVKNSSLLTINSGGTLNFNGYSDAIGTISGSGSITNIGSLYLTIGNAATFSGAISGSGALTLGTASATSFDLNGNDSYTGGTTVNAGTLIAQNLSALGSGGITITGGLLQFANTFHGTLTIPSLAISGGSLDTGKTDLLIKYTGTNPYSSLLSSLKSAYDAGKWDGVGIYSSSLKTGMSLGIYDNSIHIQSTLDGIAATSTSLLIKYTWLGDANDDGVVNSADLAAISPTGTTWQTGDFNYDGKVNGDDYALFMLGDAESAGANISTKLPEPKLSLSAICLAPLICRRRRRDEAFAILCVSRKKLFR